MSRTSTTSAAAPQTGKAAQTTTAQMPQASVPIDKVAARAYEKWLKGGCKHGNDKKDWLEAEAEVKAELARTAKK